ETETVSVTENGSITLSSTALTSANNSYQWYKDGAIIPGATAKDLVIANATAVDAGVYHFIATNSIVTGLTLERNPITLTIAEDTCGVSEAEKQALIDLYNSTDGANWTNNTNWLTNAPVCDWYGVVVENSKVTRLLLQNNNLTGEIPVSIGNLISIEILSFQSNNLSGVIPNEIGDLQNLLFINFFENSLSGSIPQSIGNLTNLKGLRLYSNELSGIIPSEIGNLTLLENLELYKNELTGIIPVSIGNLINLEVMDLEGNNLEGSIPSTISALKELVRIRLSNNNLSGTIPQEIGSLDIITLLLSNNQFTGSLPSSLQNLRRLQNLGVRQNRLSGDLLANIENMPSISSFRIDDNEFVFSGLEEDFTKYQTVLSANGFSYSPQAKVDQEETIEVQLGGSVTLSTTQLTSPNNTYTWYKGTDELIQTTLPQITIDNITAADLGEYYFTATNSIVTGLTLERNKITLVLGNPDSEDCDILEGVVDGSFEQCASVAGIIGTELTNNDLSCSSFETPNNLMYSWTVDQNNQGVLGEITNLIQPSPDGGAFASCRVYQQQSSFPSIILSALEKDIEALEVGAEYEISFYQSNGGYFGATTEFEASWRVSWGDGFGGSGISPAMLVKGGIGGNTTEAPSWDLVKLIFIATDETLKLKFTPVVPAHNNVDNGVLTHLLIDGIKINKVDGCNDDITEQRFCGAYETEPTIGDLVSPIPNTNVTWYASESANDVLLPATILSDNTVYWAGSTADNSLPRVGVLVILENTFPAGPATQVFEAVNNPTVADLQPNGTNVQWYLSEVGGSPLSNTSALADNTKYYASENNGLCRLEVLVTINTSGGGDDCNLLDGVVDGSFQDCALVAGSTLTSSYNNNIQCGSWEPLGAGEGNPIDPNAVPSTWIVDLSGSAGLNPVISTEVRQSPDGGIFASALVTHGRGSSNVIKSQGFKTTLSNLEIGATYTVSFYQSNGGGFEITGNPSVPNIENVLANWRVFFGNEVKNSDLIPIQSMADISSAPVWEKQEITFVPTETEQELSFVSFGSLINVIETVFYYNLLIDGIKVTKVGEDCTNDISEQRFCGEYETLPTVGDLVSPIPNTNVTWYASESANDVLLPATVLSDNTVYWAGSIADNSLPRVGVRVILENTFPTGPTTQVFEATNNPTVADLQVSGTNIQWYLSEVGGSPLSSTNSLSNNTRYYASENNGLCRLEVLVTVNTSGGGEDCDVLEGLVDGSFQDCALVAGATTESDPNNNIGCSNWEPFNGLSGPSTWIVDLSEEEDNPDLGDPDIIILPGDGDVVQMSNLVRQSPDGGIFASGLVSYKISTGEGQGFKTTLTNLEPGTEYTVSFYQSHGGSFNDPFGLSIFADTKWQVVFGAETKVSNAIAVSPITDISATPTWEKVEMIFIPTSTEQEISFSTIGVLNADRPTPDIISYHLLIDGIKVTKEGEDCTNDIAEQEFCLSEGIPTINDLASPFPNSIAWFENETGGAPLPSAQQITETVVLWAEGNSSNPRVAVRIVIKEGEDCYENLVQEFCADEGIPTINDLASPFPNSIAWFENETGGAPLPARQQITETVTLWAEGNSSNPRVEVQIIIIENCSGIAIQRFCILNGDITIGDLQSPFIDSDANWFLTELDKALILPEYVIPESGTYWAESIENPSLPRIPINVILDDQIPFGDTTQIFDVMNGPTVADLQATGANVQWYLSENGEIPLISTIPLVNNTYYYAAIGNSPCRLRVTVVINGVVDDCNLLDNYVDGSFENCESIASSFGHNGNVTCGQWINGKGSADTWSFPFNVIHSGIADNVQPSPDGGVAAGAIAKSLDRLELESFYTNLDALNIGETYRIEFYQSNVTGNFNPTEGLEQARWKVIFGDQTQYSEFMVVTENPVWQKSTLEFVANTSQARLEFNASSTNITRSTNYIYMLIDGIKLTQLTGEGAECNDDTVYDTQSFCSMFGDPTVGDLLPPDGATDVVWYSSQVGGNQYSPDDLLLVGINGILSANVYWAESSQFIGRKPVRVIIDEGIPTGNTLQFFETSDNATIADLQVTGTNVQWYASPFDQTALPLDTALTNGYTYYAEHNGLECRLAVEVEIELSEFDVDGIQILCASDEPTIADLVAVPSNASYTVNWYDSITATTPLSPDTRIENSRFYFVSQSNGNTESERVSVYVSIISVPPPFGASVQTIYTNDGATVRNLIAIGVGVQWYDGDGVILSLDEPLEDGGIYYADQTDISGVCRSAERLEVRVRILPELAPQYFSCEKFRPKPGSKYVVSGWIRENGVKIASTETKNYSEISELFAQLLNELKEIIVTQTPVPPVYVPSPEDRAYDALVPYIKTTGINNLTIYNLKPVKEDQGGFVRTVGFSFSFDEEGQTTFTYKTPLNSFTSNNIYYSFPIIGNEDAIDINFTGLQNCSQGLCVNTVFTYRTVIVIIPITINYDQSVSVTNVIKENVDFNTYVPDPEYQVMDYMKSLLKITYTDREGKELEEGATISLRPKGNIIDGWQRISADFTIPNNAEFMTISLQSEDNNLNVYFDDIRFHPFDSNMKTFVYDPETQRLQSELDENNYSTFYEYDIEGGLIRVKKETERGVYTIQETRSGNSKLNNND
ncbi:hypothetical protein, partial [uncultured Aquimarina sp.]|uniref:hypothetical protein n=1 Tax=uncultured Aquimarina sp. TaxID=575652 RepID=UPI00262E0E55